MIRDDIKDAMVTAMKARDKDAVGALRLIQSEIKNRDIFERTNDAPTDDDAMVVTVLQKMLKQRRESIEQYIKASRQDLADAEAYEITVIERFLPQMMTEAETVAAIQAIKTELGLGAMKDMGTLMATLKARHGKVLDMSQASRLVKAALG